MKGHILRGQSIKGSYFFRKRNKYIFRLRKRRSNGKNVENFPGGPVAENSPAKAEDMGLIPG